MSELLSLTLVAALPLVALPLAALAPAALPLADLWFALLFALLAAFLVLDGFDFGVGVLFAVVDDEAVEEQLLAAIGPFWDGNEVWLVVFGGALFAAFPGAYANLLSRHYLLVFAVLAGLGLRGLAPEVYEQRPDRTWRRVWGGAFVLGSAGTPLAVGLLVTNWVTGATATLTLSGLLGGVAVLALSVADGAAFLAVKTRSGTRRFARRVVPPATVAALLAVLTTVAAVVVSVPRALGALLAPAGVAALGVAVLASAGAVLATRRERDHLALAAVWGLVVAFVASAGLIAHPYVDPATELTVRAGIVTEPALSLMSALAALLLPLVAAYFVVLYGSFAGPIDEEGYA